MAPLENRSDEQVSERPLERIIESIPQWVLPAAIALGAATIIGFGVYLNSRHQAAMDDMRRWYEENPQVYALPEPSPPLPYELGE